MSAAVREKIVWITAVAAAFICLVVGNRIAVQGLTVFGGTDTAPVEKVRVAEVLGKQVKEPRFEGMPGGGSEIKFRAVVLSGPNRGQELEAMQIINPMEPYPLKEARPGVKFLVTKDLSGMYDPDTWYASQDVRTDALAVLGLIFVAGLLLLGRKKGFDTILSMGFTCAAVFLILIPAVLSGKNIYFWSFGVCVYIVVMTLLLVTRANLKSLGAGLGCVGGILASSGLTLLMSALMGLSGIVDEESYYLQYLNGENPIDLRAIIFAAILIGAIGAVMDVAVSIATSLYEVCRNTQAPDFYLLLKSGVAIGQDMIGTMANTLVLAYIGGSLSTVLLLAAYNRSVISLLNREMIVVEVLQALVGSLGILLTVPLTSAACALLYAGKPKGAVIHRLRLVRIKKVVPDDGHGGLSRYVSLRDKFIEPEEADGRSD